VALSFFDQNVDASEKRAMVERLHNKGEDDPPKRIHLDQSAIHNKRLCDLVTRNTRKLFEILSIPDSFIEVDPETWITNPDYLTAENVVRELRDDSMRSCLDAGIQYAADKK